MCDTQSATRGKHTKLLRQRHILLTEHKTYTLLYRELVLADGRVKHVLCCRELVPVDECVTHRVLLMANKHVTHTLLCRELVPADEWVLLIANTLSYSAGEMPHTEHVSHTLLCRVLVPADGCITQ